MNNRQKGTSFRSVITCLSKSVRQFKTMYAVGINFVKNVPASGAMHWNYRTKNAILSHDSMHWSCAYALIKCNGMFLSSRSLWVYKWKWLRESFLFIWLNLSWQFEPNELSIFCISNCFNRGSVRALLVLNTVLIQHFCTLADHY